MKSHFRDGQADFCGTCPCGKCMPKSITTPALVSSVLASAEEALAEQYHIGVPTMKLILDGLQQPLGHDMREGKVDHG